MPTFKLTKCASAVVSACLWAAIPAPTERINLKYVSSSGSDSNPGTPLQPWRTIQGPLTAGAIAANTTIRIMGTTYSAPGGAALLNSIGGAAALPNGITIIPDLGPLQCTVDGTGGSGEAFQFWYPSTPRSDLLIQGFIFQNFRSATLTGGRAFATFGGDFRDIRFINNTISNCGFPNGSLDHIFYIAGGFTHATAARDLLFRYNRLINPVNQGHAIKIGSGGGNTAGPNGDQPVGQNSHGIDFRFNCVDTKGWGALLVTGEYMAGSPANTVISDNEISCDCTDIRQANGTPETAIYSGPIYWTWNEAGRVGCDPSFVFENNTVHMRAADASRTDWHVLYNLRAPATVTQSNPHNPTVQGNKLSNAASARIMAGIPTGTNIPETTPTFNCCTSLPIGSGGGGGTPSIVCAPGATNITSSSFTGRVTIANLDLAGAHAGWQMGMHWSTDELNWTGNTPAAAANGVLSVPFSGIPSGVTIYYQGYAYDPANPSTAFLNSGSCSFTSSGSSGGGGGPDAPSPSLLTMARVAEVMSAGSLNAMNYRGNNLNAQSQIGMTLRFNEWIQNSPYAGACAAAITGQYFELMKNLVLWYTAGEETSSIYVGPGNPGTPNTDNNAAVEFVVLAQPKALRKPTASSGANTWFQMGTVTSDGHYTTHVTADGYSGAGVTQTGIYTPTGRQKYRLPGPWMGEQNDPSRSPIHGLMSWVPNIGCSNAAWGNVAALVNDGSGNSNLQNITWALAARLVPWDENQPIGAGARYVICVSSDPYINACGSQNGACTPGIAASKNMPLTTSWQAYPAVALRGAGIEHTNGGGAATGQPWTTDTVSGITYPGWNTNHPPEYL